MVIMMQQGGKVRFQLKSSFKGLRAGIIDSPVVLKPRIWLFIRKSTSPVSPITITIGLIVLLSVLMLRLHEAFSARMIVSSANEEPSEERVVLAYAGEEKKMQESTKTTISDFMCLPPGLLK